MYKIRLFTGLHRAMPVEVLTEYTKSWDKNDVGVGVAA